MSSKEIKIVQRSELILEYINQHYAIKPDVMRELKKDENVRRILEGVNKTLQADKWNYVDCGGGVEFAIFGNNQNDSGNYCGYHFYIAGDCFCKYEQNVTSPDEIVSSRLMTPEEIQSMLIKKLEAEGLKVGCRVDNQNIVHYCTWKPEVKNLSFRYIPDTDTLLVSKGNITVYEKGKFAKIIQPELTYEQKVDVLWEKLNLYENGN